MGARVIVFSQTSRLLPGLAASLSQSSHILPGLVSSKTAPNRSGTHRVDTRKIVWGAFDNARAAATAHALPATGIHTVLPASLDQPIPFVVSRGERKILRAAIINLAKEMADVREKLGSATGRIDTIWGDRATNESLAAEAEAWRGRIQTMETTRAIYRIAISRKAVKAHNDALAGIKAAPPRLPGDLTAAEIHDRIEAIGRQMARLQRRLAPIQSRISNLMDHTYATRVTDKGAHMTAHVAEQELLLLRNRRTPLTRRLYQLFEMRQALINHPNSGIGLKRTPQGPVGAEARHTLRAEVREQRNQRKMNRIKRQRFRAAEQAMLLNGEHDVLAEPGYIRRCFGRCVSEAGRHAAYRIDNEQVKAAQAAQRKAARENPAAVEQAAPVDPVAAAIEAAEARRHAHLQEVARNWHAGGFVSIDPPRTDVNAPASLSPDDLVRAEIREDIAALEGLEDFAMAEGGKRIHGRPSSRATAKAKAIYRASL